MRDLRYPAQTRENRVNWRGTGNIRMNRSYDQIDCAKRRKIGLEVSRETRMMSEVEVKRGGGSGISLVGLLGERRRAIEKRERRRD
jgi:hypothetical protein